MKKLLVIPLLALCFLPFIPCEAQFNVYHPFPVSNAVWCEDSSVCNCIDIGCTTYGYNFVINGDTIVNGLTYHKVYQNAGYITFSCGGAGGTEYYYSNNFFGAYREDTLKHIFACCTSYLGSHDSLLYDFNLQVGDTLKQFNQDFNLSPYPFTVSSIDSTLVGGSYRKRFNIEIPGPGSGPPSIIEGIGSTQGLFDFMCNPFEIASNLNNFSQNGRTAWPYPATDSCNEYVTRIPTVKDENNLSVFPNPNNGKFTFQFSVEGNQSSVEIYNVLGEKVFRETLNQALGDNTIDLSSQPNGVYFYRIITENGELIGDGKLIIQK